MNAPDRLKQRSRFLFTLWNHTDRALFVSVRGAFDAEYVSHVDRPMDSVLLKQCYRRQKTRIIQRVSPLEKKSTKIDFYQMSIFGFLFDCYRGAALLTEHVEE